MDSPCARRVCDRSEANTVTAVRWVVKVAAGLPACKSHARTLRRAANHGPSKSCEAPRAQTIGNNGG